MNHTCSKYLFAFAFTYTLSTCCFLFAQNPLQWAPFLQQTQSNALLRFAAEREQHFITNRATALKWATSIGFLTKWEGGELMGLDETGFPIFYSTDNTIAATSIGTSRVRPGGGLGLRLTGRGMIMGEWDGGAVRLSHREFDGRVIQKDGASFTECNHLANHATHVAGTLIASGVDPVSRGMAYEATLWANDWGNDEAEMARQASEGLLVSNHSYGRPSGWQFTNSGQWVWNGDPVVNTREDFKFGFYDQQARTWDNIARMAPFYLIVKAAGNDRGDNERPAGEKYLIFNRNGGTEESTAARNPDGEFDCISTYGVAKNILTVGAVKDIPTGYRSPNDVEITDFSSFGPADDGRIKPDLVANGDQLFSTVCSGDDRYELLSGTSMASPSLSGSLLLIQQHYHNLNKAYMRAATLKGLAIHTADEAGVAPGPDCIFGWGLANIGKAAVKISQEGNDEYILEEELPAGVRYTYNLTAAGNKPVKATISWTDLPGTPTRARLDPTDRMLVNDLDIRLQIGDTTYLPWVVEPSRPAGPAVRRDNSVDNVEQITIENLPLDPGTPITLTVTHKGRLVAESNQPLIQPYSLFISGADLSLIGCRGRKLLQEFEGQFEDGSGNVDYLNNSNCLWSIEPPAAAQIEMGFDSLQLAAGDSIIIYDGNTMTDSLIRIITNNDALPLSSNFSSGGKMLVRFVTNAGETAPGWSAWYRSSFCKRETIVTNPIFGTITDGSGDSLYKSNTRCCWNIQMRDVQSIRLNFTRFDTEADKDVVTISDSTGKVLFTFSGDQRPNVLDIPGQSVQICFSTDSANQKSGWNIDYSPGAFCRSGNILTDNSGTFSDGSGTNSYLNRTRCSWRIAPENQRWIKLHFNEFRTERTSDYVQVFDGPDSTSRMIAEFSGPTRPRDTIRSTGGTLFVTFRSDAAGVMPGWRATYETVPTSRTSAVIDPSLIDIYPNPTSSGIFVQRSTALTGEARYLLHDMTGRTVESWNPAAASMRDYLPLSSVAKGLYILHIQIGNQSMQHKIMVE
jgi:hypothetical protein